jgi:hypothetical protein
MIWLVGIAVACTLFGVVFAALNRTNASAQTPRPTPTRPLGPLPSTATPEPESDVTIRRQQAPLPIPAGQRPELRPNLRQSAAGEQGQGQPRPEVGQQAQDLDVVPAGHYRPDLIRVAFRPGTAASERIAIITGLGAQITFEAQGSDEFNEVGVRVPQTLTAKELVRALRSNSNILYAELIQIQFPTAWNQPPNDPCYGSCNTNFGPRGQEHLDRIRAPQAWNVTRGASVLMANIENGQAQHPDLNPNVEMTRNLCDPPSTSVYNGDSHAAGTAGLQGAVTNNGFGIAATHNRARMFLLGWPDLNGQPGCQSLDSRGPIRQAVDPNNDGNGSDGAKVVNVSLLWCKSDSYLADIRFAQSQGAFIVIAAGNNDIDPMVTNPPQCPTGLYSAYALTEWNVISAGAVGQRQDDGWTSGPDQRGGYSNYGSSVTLAAPVCTASLLPNSGYNGCMNGTSAAAPIIAAVTAMVLEVNPNIGSAMKALLRDTGDPRGLVAADNYKDIGPIVNAWAALTYASGSYKGRPALLTVTSMRDYAGGPVYLGAYCPWDDGGVYCYRTFRIGGSEWWSNGDAVFDLTYINDLGLASGANRGSNFLLCDHPNCLSVTPGYNVGQVRTLRAWRKVGTGSESCPDSQYENPPGFSYCYTTLDLTFDATRIVERLGGPGMHVAFEQHGATTGMHQVFFNDTNNNGIKDAGETYPYVYFSNF